MRELNEAEINEVSGGNGFFPNVVAAHGAYNFGYAIGMGINHAFHTTTGMSIGEYIYEKVN